MVDPPDGPLVVGDSAPIGAYDAKTHLPRLLVEVEAGRSFVITRHGRPIARLVPAETKPAPGDVIDALRALARALPDAPFDLAAAIAEGRR